MNHWSESFYYRSAKKEILNTNELNIVWESANTAMHSGDFSIAFIAVETLLLQAAIDNIPADMLSNPRNTKCCQNLSEERSQGLVDRVNSLNFYVAQRRGKDLIKLEN